MISIIIIREGVVRGKTTERVEDALAVYAAQTVRTGPNGPIDAVKFMLDGEEVGDVVALARHHGMRALWRSCPYTGKETLVRFIPTRVGPDTCLRR